MKDTFINNNRNRISDTIKDIKKNLLNINENTVNKADNEEKDINSSQATEPISVEPSEVKPTRNNPSQVMESIGINTNPVMPPPLINFVTFNRMGVTIRNLKNLLDSDEDFELHLTDCNSKDNTWDFIQSLDDKRIKSKTRFTLNLGPIYVANFNLSKLKPNQYFITIDSDVYIKTKNWISKFMEVFDAFPDLGLLGLMRDKPYPRYMPIIIPRVKGDISYLQLKNAEVDVEMDFVPGQLQCLRPELIKEIGYWSEENGYGDAELSPRIVHYTRFNVGFLTNVEIDMTQSIGCDECQGRDICKLNKSITPCFSLSKTSNKNESFAKKFKWKYIETFKELEEGKRTAYCASVHEPESMNDHFYNNVWAAENFDFYLNNSN